MEHPVERDAGEGTGFNRKIQLAQRFHACILDPTRPIDAEIGGGAKGEIDFGVIRIAQDFDVKRRRPRIIGDRKSTRLKYSPTAHLVCRLLLATKKKQNKDTMKNYI